MHAGSLNSLDLSLGGDVFPPIPIPTWGYLDQMPNLLRRIPTFSSDGKRIWTPITAATGSTGLAIFGLLPFVWGKPFGITWQFLALLTIVLINRRSRYNRKAIETILQVLIDDLNVRPECEPYFTVWAPRERGREDWLEQVTNPLPGGDVRASAGDTLQSSKGIQGHAFRSQKWRLEVYTEDAFPERKSIVDHHVANYGFTKREAQETRSNQRCYLAVPIMDGSRAVGVIYCDSSDPTAFSPELAEKVSILTPYFRYALSMEGE